MNKEHAIIAQNSATAAAAIYNTLYPEPPFVVEIFEDIREAIFNGTLALATIDTVTQAFPGTEVVTAATPLDRALAPVPPPPGYYTQADTPPAPPAGYSPALPPLPSALESPPPPPVPAAGAPSEGAVPSCPQCGGAMWDNRADKRNPKAPDFKCKDKSCGKGVWATPFKR